MRLFALVSLFFIFSSQSVFASCYSSKEAEAEQGIRIHSELMVIGLNCGICVESLVYRSVVALTFTVKHTDKIRGRCPYQKQTYVFEKFNNLSSINAISNKTTTGIATRNNDTGSGGDKNAPRTNAANQICFRYCLIWLGEVRP